MAVRRRQVSSSTACSVLPGPEDGRPPSLREVLPVRRIITSPRANGSDELELSVFMEIYGALSLCPHFNIRFAH